MKAALVDYRISHEEKEGIEALNIEVLIVPPSELLYAAVCGHPDMLLNLIDCNTIVVHKNMDINFMEKIKKYDYKILYSENSLKSNYPFDITLNAVNFENLFIHNTKYTDNVLLNNVSHKKKISVPQGYTKCSTAIVSNNAVMTSDLGIARALSKEAIDVLLLPPGDILLPELNYGFIGGCCGLLEEGLIAFYGDLINYYFKDDVYKFLKKHKVEPLFLSKGKLIDRGSILTL